MEIFKIRCSGCGGSGVLDVLMNGEKVLEYPCTECSGGQKNLKVNFVKQTSPPIPSGRRLGGWGGSGQKMDFADALWMMKRGLQLHYAAWPESSFAEISNGVAGFGFYNQDGKSCFFSFAEMFSDDGWSVFVPTVIANVEAAQ